MRVLLVIAAIVLLLAVVGWIKFSDAPDRSTITIEKEAIRHDTESMVDRGNEFLDNARDTVTPGEPEAHPPVEEPAPVEPAPRVANPNTPPLGPPGPL